MSDVSAKRFEDAVVRDRLHAARIVRVRLLLDERLLVPDRVDPATSPIRRLGVAVNDRPVHPFRLTASELGLQLVLRARRLREDDEAGRVEVDAMHDERSPLAARAEMILDVVVRRHRAGPPLERDRQHAGRLVEDDERVVFVAGCARLPSVTAPGRRRRAARSIHPDRRSRRQRTVAAMRPPASASVVVEEDLAALERRARPCCASRGGPAAARNLSSRVPGVGGRRRSTEG